MCHGGLDTKYIVADIEARLRHVPSAARQERIPAPAVDGLLARLRAWVRAVMRKEWVHG
jgi:hypothetical protein